MVCVATSTFSSYYWHCHHFNNFIWSTRTTTHLSLPAASVTVIDIFLFLFTAQEANSFLTDRFVKLRWQAAHVYSMESTTCDVSPNFLLRSLVALRRPRSSGLYEAEDKTTTLQSCSTAVLLYSHVRPQYYTSHVWPQYYATATFNRSTTLVTFNCSTTLQSHSTAVLR